MRFLLFLLFVAIPVAAFPQDPPVPSVSASDVRKGMVWNKWETKNFVILSIDRRFGERMKASLESDRLIACENWGIFADSLPVKCKFVCVPDASLLEELFSIKFPRSEIKRDESDRIREIAIWIDQERMYELGDLLVSISLHDAPVYVQRGVGTLSRSAAQSISSVSSASFEDLFLKNRVEFAKMKDEEKASFDSRSAVVCLFLRKEFGKRALERAAAGARPNEACGFEDNSSFFSTLNRYFTNLKSDLRSGRTPDHYLKP